MPLIIISGTPSSGKTHTTELLKQFFTSKNKIVNVVSENEVAKEKNAIFESSPKEKTIRDVLKSEVTRLINSEDVLVLDALNYIKGYRYELYCLAKHHKTTHCVVQCATPLEKSWAWNLNRPREDQYAREVFDALNLRYESPDSRNRWDSPYFAIVPDTPMNYDTIFDALYGRAAPPPNQSTQVQPQTHTNYLQELERCTQEVVNAILNGQKIGLENLIKIDGVDESISFDRKVSLAELSRHKRQFISYSTTHRVTERDKIKNIFVQYLNKNIS